MEVRWKPQPKQEIALKSNANEILFGGARGGGKTDTGMTWLMYDIEHPKYRALVIRRNATDLSDWIDRARDMYSGSKGKMVGDTFIFPSGARIRTGHLADKEAYQKYQGHEYHKIVMEELTHIARESDYEKLLASCRSTVDGLVPQIFCTTNPDGPGHEWVKERWEIPDTPSEPVTSFKKGRKLVFIPSSVYDNEILITKDKEYVKYLESIEDEELRRAWLEGSWEGFGVEGAYYREQMRRTESEGRVVSNLYDPLIPVSTWCDLGIADSFSIGYFQAIGKEVRVIDYDEFEGEGLKDAIRRMAEKGYNYDQHYAPHDIEVRELGTGISRLETARGFGINYNVVPKLGIQDGIDALRMRFVSLWFDKEKCKQLMAHLKRYHKEFDEKRGVYKNKPAHDPSSHGADMMRYWAVTKVYNEDHEQEYRIYKNRSNNRSMR
uniref:PBSX family phage terminase large subunit n=1 Tax=uncultured marine virus TaxID=186617 RepID=A0A0F7L8U7_9VIRU|nr:PBSX family phage terminase large subunit [uncultured marine virus]